MRKSIDARFQELHDTEERVKTLQGKLSSANHDTRKAHAEGRDADMPALIAKAHEIQEEIIAAQNEFDMSARICEIEIAWKGLSKK